MLLLKVANVRVKPQPHTPTLRPESWTNHLDRDEHNLAAASIEVTAGRAHSIADSELRDGCLRIELPRSTTMFARDSGCHAAGMQNFGSAASSSGSSRSSLSSLWSLWSQDSVLSIGSRGSVLSIGSVGSFASIGSVGSALSIFSMGSWLSAGSVLSSASRWSLLSHLSRRGVLAVANRGLADV